MRTTGSLGAVYWPGYLAEVGEQLLEQAVLLGGAALLGCALGILYDALRVLRERLAWRWLCHMADALFWLAVAVGLFTFSLEVGDGRVRLFYVAAAVLGAAFYFLTASPLLLWLLRWLADGVTFLCRLLATPLRALIGLCKKVSRKAKKLFQIFEKSVKIKLVCNRQKTPREGAAHFADQKGWISDQVGDFDPFTGGIFGVGVGTYPDADRPEGTGGAGDADKEPDRDQRRVGRGHHKQRRSRKAR